MRRISSWRDLSSVARNTISCPSRSDSSNGFSLTLIRLFSAAIDLISGRMRLATTVAEMAGLLFSRAVSFSNPTFPPPTINVWSDSIFRKTGKRLFRFSVMTMNITGRLRCSLRRKHGYSNLCKPCHLTHNDDARVAEILLLNLLNNIRDSSYDKLLFGQRTVLNYGNRCISFAMRCKNPHDFGKFLHPHEDNNRRRRLRRQSNICRERTCDRCARYNPKAFANATRSSRYSNRSGYR